MCSNVRLTSRSVGRQVVLSKTNKLEPGLLLTDELHYGIFECKSSIIWGGGDYLWGGGGNLPTPPFRIHLNFSTSMCNIVTMQTEKKKM